MADLWESLGFSQSPYDARPLRPVPEDEVLLVGRQEEAVQFCTTLESAEEGIMVLSGPPGVGKTSFFNVQQYRLANDKAEFGPKLLAAERPCSIYPEDDPRTIALRVVENLVRSVQIACTVTSRKVPTETATVGKWLNRKGSTGFDIGLQVLSFGGNFGRSVTLPDIDNISFEGLQEAIEAIVSEAVSVLGFDGVFLALDNVENLSDEELKKLLITFRDTLFMIPRVWWVLIGQSGLGGLIQTLDPRVSDRLSSVGLELQTLPFSELEEAIALRVGKFSRDKAGARSPLPTEVHRKLYEASQGEIRFVFRYSHEVCTKFVESVRKILIKSQKDEGFYKRVADRVAETLINSQIPAKEANALLEAIVTQEFNGLNLKPRDKKVLRTFAEKKEARPKDYASFGCNSVQDFYSNYISKLHSQHLLARRQQGNAVFYRLRGIPVMAFELGLMKNGG